MAEHTPVPWRLETPEPESGAAMVEGTVILAENAPSGFLAVAECLSPDRMEADARRIVAAVNATEGLTTPELESCAGGWLAKNQRDLPELLDLVRDACDWYDDQVYDGPEHPQRHLFARLRELTGVEVSRA